MNEEFGTSFDTFDMDFSSNAGCDTSGDILGFSVDGADYDSLDDISADVPDFCIETEDYNTLDDIPDMKSDEISENVPVMDSTKSITDVETGTDDNMFEVYSDNEYKALEDVPDEATTIEEDETSDIETLDSIQEDEFVAEEDEQEYETLDDIPDNENDEVLNVDEVLTVSNVPETMELAELEMVDGCSDTAEAPNDLNSAVDKIMDSELNTEHKKELLQDLRDEVSQESTNTEIDEDDVESCSELYQETEDKDIENDSDDDSPKVLKRELSDEELAGRDRDIEETLDNYRENLRDYGVNEETIEEFIDEERDKINAQYESLDNGDTSSNIYHMPTNWEEVANELKNPEKVSDSTNVEQIGESQDIDDISGWLSDINPNFDEFDPESPYCNNCGSCAFAVYNRLNGDTNMCATADNIGYNDEMNALTGMEQVSMSPDEIESRLLAEGNGAHAIIGIDRAEGPGHWFNAACVDGKVVAIDGQSGEIIDWPPDYGDVVNWEMSVKK